MKTFKIIGVTALLIVLFEFIGGFNDGWSDVDKLAPISIESADPAFDKVTACNHLRCIARFSHTSSQLASRHNCSYRIYAMSFIHRTQRTDKFHLYTAWNHRAGILLWTLQPHPSVYLYHPQRGIYIHQYPTDTVGSLSSYCLSLG